MSQCPFNLLIFFKKVESDTLMPEQKRYNIYYEVNETEFIFKTDVTEEQMQLFLENLTPTEKSYLRIVQVKNKNELER